MTYKRQIGSLPIVPADAKEHNVVCHYCIVGCGYKAYSWSARYEGGTAPADNKFGVDLSKQQEADTAAWYSPSMYNIVKQNGQDVHIVIKPDHDCVVNSGLGSPRGARMAEMSYSRQRNTQLQRLTDPLVWRYGQMQPTSWDDALDLVARVTAAVIAEQGEDGLFVSAFDHGGAGGGYENTWGTGKLYFGAMKVKNIRIHNRPAYNSEVHGTRDMGVGELNNCYEDAELADTIVAVGTNALETQTNYFLNHWIPNLRGTSVEKKKAEFGNESVDRGRVVFVDPRRTVTVNACEIEAGKDNVLHLPINSGTDLILFNAWLTYAADKGWIDRPFIAASTKDFDKAVAANRTSLAEAAKTTGLSEADIVKAITWIAEPKTDGARRRTMFAYEKGLIWGNDNYRTNQSLVNLALATGNVGRPGGGCVRMGGHQEGYCRPSDAHVGKPAAYVDLARILSDIREIEGHRLLSAGDAVGLIAAVDVVSGVALPRFDNSAVDGFGIHEADLRNAYGSLLQLRGTTLAGQPAGAEIARGICRRILTGAIVSPDVCAIVMEEHVRRNGSSVEIVRRPERGANIRRAGEDVPLGEVVIRRGTLLDARHAAMLAAAGTADLLVKRPLRVAVLSTGDELTGAAAGAGEGKIPDTNRPLLLSLLTGKAVEVVDLGIARDDRRALADRFIDASARFDLLVSTGGVSGSEADHVSPALRSAGGRCEPMRLALRPGKPISSGRLGAMTVVALPGNPVAALVGYVLFVRAVVRKLLGHRGRPVSWTARTAHVFEHRVGRTEFVPVSVSGHDDVGLPLLRKLGGGGSACLQPLVEADGFARISPDGGDVPAGEVVTFYPFSSIHQL